jgi:hypothetical protein
MIIFENNKEIKKFFGVSITKYLEFLDNISEE